MICECVYCLGGGFSVTVDIAQGQAVENSQIILRCRTTEQASSYRWTFASVSNKYNFFFFGIIPN